MPNRLADSTSPYLLQHKDNPVDWYEWGEEAFADAEATGRPILLSVGYSACHWCHVMAHESFEDPETATYMNEQFVNIKVDREERPDVDSIYMEAVQAMTGRGGWPMTVWLTPDRKPFYAGTYFPNTERHGMPSFRRVLESISDAWQNRSDELIAQADQLAGAVNRDLPAAGETPGSDLLEAAYDRIAAEFDPANGGFGAAPKFPQQPVLEYLLRIHGEQWAPRAGEMLRSTLWAMADGGIHDQLGGGFARYSVDARWLVPHFEKMLYDNAQLARLYLWAGIEFEEARFVEVARSTLDYMLGDLRHPDGGFYSAEDADSEGVEGKFYVWARDEFDDVLGDDAGQAATFYGVTTGGNFEGTNVLHRPTDAEWDDTMESVRSRLLDHRAARVRPGLDDKIVASWNGLALRAFAEAGAALHDDGYLDAARSCASFIAEHLIVDGTLQRSWREGRASVPGFLEDHAAVAVGMFALFAASGEFGWYEIGRDLTLRIGDRFADPNGGFFDTSSDAERLIKRPKSQADNPLPSGNALGAEATLMLAGHTGDDDLRLRGMEALHSAGLLMERYPSMVGHHLSVLFSSSRMRELAVVGPAWAQLSLPYWDRFRPEIVVAGSPTGEEPMALFADRASDGDTLAYLCEGHVCNLPTGDPAALSALLAAEA
ncbi:MAG: thioredoxin domain-containing protein [Acidimicrobiia bacterium]|nr:MAG: thioredoxin domain-containing protein [Acidimicrobiia bacterium]